MALGKNEIAVKPLYTIVVAITNRNRYLRFVLKPLHIFRNTSYGIHVVQTP